MKVNRNNLKSLIEEIIGDGVLECEEVDRTAQKVMDAIESLIVAVEVLKPN